MHHPVWSSDHDELSPTHYHLANQNNDTPPGYTTPPTEVRSERTVEQPSSRSSACSCIRQTRSRRARAATPWNPLKIMTNGNEGTQKHRVTLARDLSQILGEFPIDCRQTDERPAEPGSFREPLWSIACLAKRDWKLESAHCDQRNTSRLPTLASSTTSLPPEDAHLLSKWTPQALKDILIEASRYFEHGLLSSKCDVAPALDPIHHGLISAERATELFQE